MTDDLDIGIDQIKIVAATQEAVNSWIKNLRNVVDSKVPAVAPNWFTFDDKKAYNLVTSRTNFVGVEDQYKMQIIIKYLDPRRNRP
ncbi:hypothetical protein BDV19DRAFT_385497 [Aspergillus venezuelensis]